MRIARYLPVLAIALTSFVSTAAQGGTPGDPRALPLIDQRGVMFRLRDLGGTPTIVTFVASRCTDACPIANAAFARSYRQLKHDHLRARFLTITLDPGYDTPAVMAAVARHYGAAPAGWRFASGKPRDIHQLMRSLGVAAEPDAHGIPETHTSFVYVLDRDVRLKRTLLLSTALTHDIEDVLGGK